MLYTIAFYDRIVATVGEVSPSLQPASRLPLPPLRGTPPQRPPNCHTDSELLRNSSGGFDIVIGNPPYIDSETMTNQGLEWERKLLQKLFKNLSGNWDIYMAFFEQALSLGQIVCFITPDKWLSKPF